jgi:molybdopterin-guanine dinucleotide biosynthesis protein A
MKLLGLVLSGGQSSRMGRDKGTLVYEEFSALDQRSRCYELLRPICEGVYISCRKEQDGLLQSLHARIFDSVGVPGPAAGILSAHEAHSDAAWLVLACDFPFVDEGEIRRLVNNRNPRRAATAYFHDRDGVLEPLFAVWEPIALERLKIRASAGDFSPRRALESLECELISPRLQKTLINVNTPDNLRSI